VVRSVPLPTKRRPKRKSLRGPAFGVQGLDSLRSSQPLPIAFLGVGCRWRSSPTMAGSVRSTLQSNGQGLTPLHPELAPVNRSTS
jgi:hypothetical protein